MIISYLTTIHYRNSHTVIHFSIILKFKLLLTRFCLHDVNRCTVDINSTNQQYDNAAKPKITKKCNSKGICFILHYIVRLCCDTNRTNPSTNVSVTKETRSIF